MAFTQERFSTLRGVNRNKDRRNNYRDKCYQPKNQGYAQCRWLSRNQGFENKKMFSQNKGDSIQRCI